MDQTDIVRVKERVNKDAEFCGKVPLHQTNLVQPHGLLLVLGKKDLTILQCSENVEDFFGKTAVSIAGISLFEFMPPEHKKALQKRLQQVSKGKIPVTITVEGQPFLVLFQLTGDAYLAEVEKLPSREEQVSFVDMYQELKYSMNAIEEATTTEAACEAAARALRDISGFDKVMIYRFDADWNGEVIAEFGEESMDTYLGLTFPASDIPKQARELYRKNPYRLIPNVDYQPIPLYPVINPLTHAFTDLTDTNLRSVAGVHLEYLKNMKVAASMSTRIMHNGSLWGLIACHHRTPKYLSYQVCSVFELISDIISARIVALLSSDFNDKRIEKQQQLTRIMENIYRAEDLREGIRNQQQAIPVLLQAGGIAFSLGKRIDTYGVTPAPDEVYNIVYWLQTSGVTKTWHVTSLQEKYDGAEAIAEMASGLMVMPIQPEKGDFLLVFRPEVIREINWGGNPAEAIRFEANRKVYHPRNSFSQYQEMVRSTSLPWKKEEVEIAENFRNFLIGYTLNHYSKQSH